MDISSVGGEKGKRLATAAWWLSSREYSLFFCLPQLFYRHGLLIDLRYHCFLGLCSRSEEIGGREGGVNGSRSIEGEKNCVRFLCELEHVSLFSSLSPCCVHLTVAIMFTSLLPSCSPHHCHRVRLAVAIVFTSLLPSCSPHHCHHVHLVASVFTSLLPVCSPHLPSCSPCFCRHVHCCHHVHLIVEMDSLHHVPSLHYLSVYMCVCQVIHTAALFSIAQSC